MSGSSNGGDNRIEILGQKISYPNTPWGAVSVLIVALAVCLIVYILAVIANPKTLELIATSVTGRLTTEGKIESSGTNYLIQFWTPSAKTQTAKPEDLDPWEKIESDEKIVEFGKVLRSDQRVQGFRYYEVSGTGKTGLKPGYWWAMNVRRDYQLSDFMQAYRSFWKNDKAIYVEILREGGRHEQ